MLKHDYLRLKAGIIADAQAKIKNLLTEIADPQVRSAVGAWNPGDPITDEYPQVDQVKEEPVKADGHSTSEPILSSEPVKQEPAETPIPPAAPEEPAADAAKTEENTNHTV